MINQLQRCLLATLALTTLAACSSSGHGGAPAGNPDPHPTQSATASASPTSQPADAATTAAIAKAYATFFGSSSTARQSQDALQHGELFTAALAAQGKSSYAQKSAATVKSVRLRSPDVATLLFTVTSNGQALLPNSPGYAVREDGTWRVAAGTFCTLLTLDGSAPKACSDPATIALPH